MDRGDQAAASRALSFVIDEAPEAAALSKAFFSSSGRVQKIGLCGPPGAGKSTLSVALARCGLSLVSDDWTYISEEADGLIAQGINAPVKLLPDAVQYFPELSER